MVQALWPVSSVKLLFVHGVQASAPNENVPFGQASSPVRSPSLSVVARYPGWTCVQALDLRFEINVTS